MYSDAFTAEAWEKSHIPAASGGCSGGLFSSGLIHLNSNINKNVSCQGKTPWQETFLYAIRNGLPKAHSICLTPRRKYQKQTDLKTDKQRTKSESSRSLSFGGAFLFEEPDVFISSEYKACTDPTDSQYTVKKGSTGSLSLAKELDKQTPFTLNLHQWLKYPVDSHTSHQVSQRDGEKL